MIRHSNVSLSDLLKVDAAAGTLHFEHRRMLLLDADAMGLLRKELIEAVGLRQARRILLRFGYACGYRDALTTKGWHDTGDLTEWLSFGPKLHTLEGIVGVHLRHLHVDKNTGVFEADAEWRNSYEAEQHRVHLGMADAPVCWTLVGYASGYASAVFGREVRCSETYCVGKGDSHCVVMARAVGDGEESAGTLAMMNEDESTHVDLRGLHDTLDRYQKDLQREQALVSSLESRILSLQETLRTYSGAEELVGTSTVFRKVIQDVEQVAPSDVAVLICGETGTGKDMVARAIHARSGRSEHSLIIVNCAALPAGLVESELFGHERGAFTGAFKQKLGRFEIANGGTIFLDEVGELSLDAQVKFLRVLQEGELERVGGARTITVNVRILAATNQPLARLMAEGKFREDLFYRLNVFPLVVPPLRERPEDILLLAHYFTNRYRAKLKKPISSIDQRSIERLQQYYWPGNVRELQHMIERAVLLSESEVLTIDVPTFNGQHKPSSLPDHFNHSEGGPLKTLAEAERLHFEKVLRHTNGLITGKGGAADILNLPPSTLRHRMKKLGLK